MSREVRISDLELAALLLTEDFSLVRLEASPDPRRKIFVVSGDADRLDQLQTSFNRCEATVNVNAFISARRRLRSALREAR